MSTITVVGKVELDGQVQGDTDVSAVDVAGDRLLIASDETNLIQVFHWTGSRYANPIDVVLKPAAEEMDIEGLTHDGDTVYVLGSHSWKRKKLDPDGSYKKNREKMEKVTAEPDHDHLCRLEPGADGGFQVKSVSLRPYLDSHPVFKTFATVPSKENGIDLEGLAAHGGRLYVGFRSPVLRGNWVPVLSCRFADAIADPEVVYLNLDGHGVRDLVRAGDGFLVLSGPSGDAPGDARLYRWDGTDCLPGERDSGQPGGCSLLGTLPEPPAGRAEGMTLLGEDANGYDLLVVFDGVAGGGPTRIRVSKP